MIRPLLMACVVSLPALLGVCLPAQAQSRPWQGNADTIRCESSNNRERVCQTGWRRAELVRQLSNAQCVEGRNWSSRNGEVRVTGGCRAEFRAAGGGQGPGWQNGGGGQGVVVCESADNRERSCRTGWRNATLARQLSRTQCVEGRNWGSRNNQVWVSGGCRGEFVQGRGGGNRPGHGSNYSVTCASDDNRTRSCAWERRQGRPVVIEQLSRTQCVENRNWGYNGNTLWVSQGCRARFGSR